MTEEVHKFGNILTQYMFYHQSNCETPSLEGASNHLEEASQPDMDMNISSHTSTSDSTIIFFLLKKLCHSSIESCTESYDYKVDVDEAESEHEHTCKAAEPVPMKTNKLKTPNIFVADTRSTCHIKVNTQGMTNLLCVNKRVYMGQSSVKIISQSDYECEAQ